MFTGIIEETGVVVQIKRHTSGIALSLEAKVCAQGTKVGDSISVNGCCLTVAALRNRGLRSQLQFDLLEETWDRTSFNSLVKGSRVNLERSLPLNGRLGGHFVTGHIDGTGRIVQWKREGQDWHLVVAPPKSLFSQIVSKGSIAIDGISLTVASVSAKTFDVWIIPHTYKSTGLSGKTEGQTVNLETDILAKYVTRLVHRK